MEFEDFVLIHLKYAWLILYADAVIDQANWDSSKTRDKLTRDIEAHIAVVRASKLAELTTLYEVWWQTDFYPK